MKKPIKLFPGIPSTREYSAAARWCSDLGLYNPVTLQHNLEGKMEIVYRFPSTFSVNDRIAEIRKHEKELQGLIATLPTKDPVGEKGEAVTGLMSVGSVRKIKGKKTSRNGGKQDKPKKTPCKAALAFLLRCVRESRTDEVMDIWFPDAVSRYNEDKRVQEERRGWPSMTDGVARKWYRKASK